MLTLFNGALGRWNEIPPEFRSIVLNIRLPRILLGILVGASLSTAGAGFQALLRNPLADPYVLGVSSGAALGAIISLIAAPQTPGAIQVGGLRGSGRDDRGGLFSRAPRRAARQRHAAARRDRHGVVSFGGHHVPDDDASGARPARHGVLADGRSFGTLPSLRWFEAAFSIFVIAAGAIYTTSSDLNLILTGEQEARHLGVNVHRVKLVVYVAASVLTGLAVSVSGAIGYVGLLVPHVMRMMFGTDYRLLIPTSALGGAILIVLADTLARTVVAPTELPVGAMTALAGAPVFIYLMRRRVR